MDDICVIRKSKKLELKAMSSAVSMNLITIIFNMLMEKDDLNFINKTCASMSIEENAEMVSCALARFECAKTRDAGAEASVAFGIAELAQWNYEKKVEIQAKADLLEPEQYGVMYRKIIRDNGFIHDEAKMWNDLGFCEYVAETALSDRNWHGIQTDDWNFYNSIYTRVAFRAFGVTHFA